MTASERSAVLDRIRRETITFVQLEFTDIPGASKSVTIPAEKLEATLDEGLWFDGSAVEGLARVAEHDLYLRPDLSTFAVVPWLERPSARIICDLHFPDGSPFLADPRRALKRALAETAELGFAYRAGCELEFSLFAGAASPLSPLDSGGYFEVTTAQAEDLCRETCRALVSLGVDVEMTHHEVAPGQHEIDLAPMDALALADAIVALKTAARTYARRRGLVVSFMPKPIEGTSGSGLHIQQELRDRQDADAFFDADDAYQISGYGRHFIAGQLAHARGLSAVIAPLVNSYKRLMGGAEAPGLVSWARTNRGSYIRVPSAAPARRMRIELRAPDPSCNPYLALAAMLAAGMDGIRGGLPLPDPVEERSGRPAARGPVDREAAELLPRTLDEALEGLEWDPLVRGALGQEIYERFLAAKEQEWEAYSAHISQWELQRYLERA